MKKLLTMLVLGLLVCGCGTLPKIVLENIPDLPDVIYTPTNPVPGEGEQEIPEEEVEYVPPASGLIAAGSFARPTVCMGKSGALMVAAEGPGMASIYFYRRPANSTKWSGGLVIESEHGGQADAGRVYVPDSETVDNVTWVSMRLGKKEWGSMHGPAIFIHSPKGASFKFLGLTHGAARLAQDGGKVYLMSKDGAWGQLDADGRIVKQGTFPAGQTGEKFDFTIDASRWYTAVNGYSKQPSSSAYGTISGGKRITWASYEAYPSQGDDLCYPSLCKAEDGTYIASIYAGKLVLQVVNPDGSTVYPIGGLAVLGTGTMEVRCPPRLLNTPDGVVVVWRRGRDIVWGRVGSLLAGKAPVVLTQGEFPAVVWDGKGEQMIVVYCDGGLKLKTVKVN